MNGLLYLVAGVVNLTAVNLLVLLGFETISASYLRNSLVLVTTHLFTLGWGSLTIMGVMSALLPVALAARLHSHRLVTAVFWLFLGGLAALLTGFSLMHSGWLITGASLLLVAVSLFLYNQILTLRTAASTSIAKAYLVFSYIYLGLVATWGFLLALNWRLGFFGGAFLDQLLTHVVLGILGWFTVTTVGVGYRLIPMFSDAPQLEDALTRAVFYTLNGGVLGLATAAFLGAPGWLLGAGLGVVAAGMSLFVWDTHRLLRRRSGRGGGLHLSVRYTLMAFIYLIMALLLGVSAWWGGWPDLTRPAGVVALVYLGTMGWVSMLIMGQMYKVLPYSLVWLAPGAATPAPDAPAEPLPATYDERLAEWGFRLMTAGVPAVAAGLALGAPWLGQAGALAVLLAGLAYAAGVWQALRAGRAAAADTATREPTPPWPAPPGPESP